MKNVMKTLIGTCAGALLFSGVALASSDTIVTTGYPYLKELPYTQQGKTYGDVPKGTKLQVLEKTNKYYIKVNYNGQVGYISTKYIQYIGGSSTPPAVKPAPVTPPVSQPDWEQKADRIIAEAKSLMSKVQYVYGVNDPADLEFDCSSFTKYLYAKQGIDLRWGARVQYSGGTPISKDQLRKGDLVFISTSKTDGYSDMIKRIGHVAIYMGDNKIIHNLNPSKDVTISDLNSTYYKAHYVAAARVIR